MMTEVVFLTAVIDAWEDQQMVVLDILGLFMHVDMDEVVHVCFHGKMVNKLLKIDKHLYCAYVGEEEREWVMYIELLKPYMECFEQLNCSGSNFAQNLWILGFVTNQ